MPTTTATQVTVEEMKKNMRQQKYYTWTIHKLSCGNGSRGYARGINAATQQLIDFMNYQLYFRGISVKLAVGLIVICKLLMP